MTNTGRNIEVAGRHTSVRLEGEYWDALEACARELRRSVDHLVVDAHETHGRPGVTRSSAIRIYLITHHMNRRAA